MLFYFFGLILKSSIESQVEGSVDRDGWWFRLLVCGGGDGDER